MVIGWLPFSEEGFQEEEGRGAGYLGLVMLWKMACLAEG